MWLNRKSKMEANVCRKAMRAHALPMSPPTRTSYQLWTSNNCQYMLQMYHIVHSHSSIVREAEMRNAPRIGAKKRTIFQ